MPTCHGHRQTRDTLVRMGLPCGLLHWTCVVWTQPFPFLWIQYSSRQGRAGPRCVRVTVQGIRQRIVLLHTWRWGGEADPGAGPASWTKIWIHPGAWFFRSQNEPSLNTTHRNYWGMWCGLPRSGWLMLVISQGCCHSDGVTVVTSHEHMTSHWWRHSDPRRDGQAKPGHVCVAEAGP